MKMHSPASLDQMTRLQNYNDLSALQSLKVKQEGAADARLDAVAQQFESIFVSMMIKSMRDANQVFAEGNMLQSSQTEFYQQMFDSQLAVTLSTSKGLGLADVIKRQLSKDVSPVSRPGMDGLSPSGSRGGFDVNSYERRLFPGRERAEELIAAVQKVQDTVAEKALNKADSISLDGQSAAPALTEKTSAPSMDFSSPEAFIESLYPYARQVEAETGIDARLMLAQSALETGWGKHQIFKADGSPSFNLFGIKAHNGWQGDKATITTTEYRQGIAMKEQADFRAYASYGESFGDYARFLKQNDRYQAVFEHIDDPKAFADALQESGYATDPNYGDKIGRILDNYLSFSEASSTAVTADAPLLQSSVSKQSWMP